MHGLRSFIVCSFALDWSTAFASNSLFMLQLLVVY